MRRLDHDQITSLFAEARSLPTGERGMFLDARCNGDPELRREIEELLAFDNHAATAFDAASDQIVQPDPRHIGAYELLESVGEGGMAVVYKAQQHKPIRRIVALKLIKLGMDTRQFVARFESERQALAMMDHPNVAQVYDAGSTPTGRPYFAMEFVPGQRILRWCDEHKLSIRQRLELFIAVCDGVEHAHRKGIIHRDLKDSNVLVMEVDGKAVPKVIDFGVAKTIIHPLGDRTAFTEHGQLIGTPAYMSPEQAERGALDVDTRSDVYSLGVLLYELLSGVEPISSETLRSGSYEEVRRLICDADPPKPATRLSKLTDAEATAVAEMRGLRSSTLVRQLHNELEWIPLKAMRKDREQRYRSAAELADDIRNYLTGRPLIAGPESKTYLFRKFLRRHRASVATALIIALLLIAGIVATSLQTIRARRAEANARLAESEALLERDNSEAIFRFLIDDVLSGATPERIPDAKVRQQIVDAMISPAAERVGISFGDRPIVEASVRETIRNVLVKIGRPELALAHSEAALAIRKREFGEDHRETLASMNNYANTLEQLGRIKEAEPIYRHVLDRRRNLFGDYDTHTLNSQNNYASVLGKLGRTAESLPLYKEAMERRVRKFGPDDPESILALSNYAAALRTLDRPAEAEPLFKEALERYQRVLGADNPRTISALNNYAYVLKSLRRPGEAGPLIKEVMERRIRVLGEDHPESIWSLSEYAQVVQAQQRLEEAEALYKKSLTRARQVMGGDHFLSIRIMNNYAAFLNTNNRPGEAEPLVKESLERRRRLLGDIHPDTLVAMNNYAILLLRLGRAVEAEPLAREAVAAATASPSMGPKHRDTQSFATAHAKILDNLGRVDEAADVRRKFELRVPATLPASAPATIPG